MAMKAVTVLKKARKLIEKRDRWCKGSEAADKDGKGLEDSKDRNAVQFCMIGAIERAADTTEASGFAKLLLGKEIPGFRHYLTYTEDPVGGMELAIADYNDDERRRHADVLKKFDKAIARAEGGAK